MDSVHLREEQLLTEAIILQGLALKGESFRCASWFRLGFWLLHPLEVIVRHLLRPSRCRTSRSIRSE